MSALRIRGGLKKRDVRTQMGPRKESDMGCEGTKGS